MRFNLIFRAVFIFLAGTSTIGSLLANQPGRTSAKNLLQAPSARSHAMADAYVARQNDLAAFGYNPASLRTLETGQASLLYRKGTFDDSFGHIAVGLPQEKGTWGASIGHYDGGDISVANGTGRRSLKAQSDFLLGVGYARTIGRFDAGVTGKYISSKLAETSSANALVADIGAGLALSKRLRAGAAYQNFGTRFKYQSENQKLPHVLRLGASYMFPARQTKNTVTFEIPYIAGETEARPAIGLETIIGSLALRAGYRSQIELNQFTFGAGFQFEKLSLDYSLGLLNELDSSHRISLTYRFDRAKPQEIVKKEPEIKREVVEISSAPLEEQVVAAQNEVAAIQAEIDQLTLEPINFEFDSSKIKAESIETLEKVMKVALKYPLLQLHIGGHTDSKGKDEYNMHLSNRRAAAVRAYLLGKVGRTEDTMTSMGYGETKPVTSNETDMGRAKNRRVEFIFSAPQQ